MEIQQQQQQQQQESTTTLPGMQKLRFHFTIVLRCSTRHCAFACVLIRVPALLLESSPAIYY